MAERFDVLVVGCGIAGLTAARECLRQGMHTATLESFLPGGLVLNINHLDGEVQGSGIDLATQLVTEIESLGGKSLSGEAGSIRADDGRLVVTSETGEIHAGAVIVASGARIKRLGIPGEAELEGQGVSQCAECDGPLFQGQDVVVVGGGDSALQEALTLSQYARHVHLLLRGETFKARAKYVDALAAAANVTVHSRTVAEAVVGDGGVRAVLAKSTSTGEIRELPCAGFFAFVGLEPVCDFVPATVVRDANGCLVTDESMRTALTKVYAAGAVRSHSGGLLEHAIADGIAAARSAHEDRSGA
jgi:thioredoxin reductase (NADPH)